jgi:toxin ParE1/3/4
VSVAKRQWRVDLGHSAQSDYQEILRWTTEHFGERQALIYRDMIDDALVELAAGPSLIGVKTRDDIEVGLFTLHIARSRRRGRHFLLFRAVEHNGQDAIEVLRILHDAMDIARHIPESNDLGDN